MRTKKYVTKIRKYVTSTQKHETQICHMLKGISEIRVSKRTTLDDL